MAPLDAHAARVADAEQRLARMPRPVMVALSGGPDSLALAALCARGGLDATAVHVHHGLHDEADAAAAHAAALAQALDLPFTLLRVDGAAIRACGRGLEAGARAARYVALAQAAGGRLVLTGHTADDRLETVLLRMVQGCGVTALSGPRRRLEIAGVEVRRPLLGLWRKDTQRVCADAGLTAWRDPMNDDLRHLRVQVRQAAAPAVRELATGDALLGSLEQLAEDARLLEALVRTSLAAAVRGEAHGRCDLDRGALRAMLPPMRRAALRAAVVRAGARPSRRVIADVARRVVTPGPATLLAHRLRIEVARDLVRIAHVDDPRCAIPPIS